MRLVHKLAKQVYIIVFKRSYGIQRPAVFGDDMHRPLSHHRIRNVFVKHPEIGNLQLTQVADLTMFRDERNSLVTL